jgi:hypothetical protein
MAAIQLKIVDEGVNANIDAFLQRLRVALLAQDIYVAEHAPICLKVKLCVDDGHEKVLIQVRESDTKFKISEQVILYFPWNWIAKCADLATEMVTEAVAVA